MGGGRNRFWQDYVCSTRHVGVVNVQMYPHRTPLETIVVLANSGYLEKLGVKSVVIESGERVCVAWYGTEVDFAATDTLANVESYYQKARYQNPLPVVKFINTGNLKLPLYALLYRLSDNAFLSQTYVRRLSRPMFSVPRADRLLFFYEDLLYLPLATPEKVRLVNANFDRLADLLAARGIKLTFLSPADKYDLYRDLIVDNPYPAPRWFELMDPLPRRFAFVDTRAIMKPLIEAGVKDVYFADDTHWSWKATEVVTRAVRFDGAERGAAIGDGR